MEDTNVATIVGSIVFILLLAYGVYRYRKSKGGTSSGIFGGTVPKSGNPRNK